MKHWNVRKEIGTEPARRDGPVLARTMSWPHLVAMGVGAIVGTGILTLIGVGVDKAGPAVLVSFLIAGFVCACAALAYAEMATMIPASGSAYTYTHVVMGEGLAWIVGWSLILEYSLVVSAVAVGWAGYAAPLFNSALGIPMALMQGPSVGGVANVAAVFIIIIVAALLLTGMRKSALVNAALVILKLAALTLFVVVALPAFSAEHLQPFSPYGFTKSIAPDGIERGVMAAAAIIFSAFYGFDAIATAAEEVRNPKRDLAIGIIGSMIACALIYTVIAAVALGAVPFTQFANSPEPLALILRDLQQPGAARFLALSAVIALPTVILAFLYGQTRIFFVMARDGLLPRSLSKLTARGAPARITLFTVAIVGVIAAIFPLDQIVALANAGTLVAFTAVAASMLIMRRRAPDAERGFRTPAAWIVGPIAIAGCGYLFVNLPQQTQLWFLAWNVAGIAIYLGIRRRRRKTSALEVR